MAAVRSLNCSVVMGPSPAPVVLPPAAAAEVAARLANPESSPPDMLPPVLGVQMVSDLAIPAPVEPAVADEACPCYRRPCFWIMAAAVALIFSGGRKR